MANFYRIRKVLVEDVMEVECPEGTTPLITPDGSHLIIVEDVTAEHNSRQVNRANARKNMKIVEMETAKTPARAKGK